MGVNLDKSLYESCFDSDDVDVASLDVFLSSDKRNKVFFLYT